MSASLRERLPKGAVRDLVLAVIELNPGARWEHRGGGHIILYPPTGGRPCPVSLSPRNDWRTAKNLRSQLRTSGFIVP